MNKSCARCQKVVYPIEELKCLDKTWHKTCFKCHECGMTLNMKTYKGFNKLPYCEAHIPKAKATTIAETPEFKRIAENTKIQSNVKYHADFEKLKGKVTQVADDPETLRIKQNTKNISNVAYHGDLQKKAAMERQRECTEIIDSKDNNDLESEYFSEQLAAESLPHYQPPPPPPVVAPAAGGGPTAQQQVNNNGGMAGGPTNTSQQAQIISTANITKHNQANSYHHQAAALQQQQQYQQMNNNNKAGGYGGHQQQPGSYPTGAAYAQHAAANNGAGPVGNSAEHVRHSVLQNSATPSGGGGGGAATQKYYDPYDNYARPNPTANQVNNNGTAGPHMGNNNAQYHHSQQQQQHMHHHHQQQQQHHGGNGMMEQQQQQQRANGAVYHQQHMQHQQQHGQPGNHHHHQHQQQSAAMVDPYGQQQQQRYSANSNSQYAGAMHAQQQQQQQQQQQHMYQYNNGNMNNGAAATAAAASAGGIGKIADYDPLTDGPRNVPQPNRQSATLIYSSGNLSTNNNRRIGSVNDIDPVNGYYGSVADNSQAALYQQQQQLYQQQQRQSQQQQQQQQQPQYIQPPQQYAAPASNATGKSMSKVRVYRALYDYEAQDSDEVGFSEGDLIIEVNSIDAGWMTGRVERTGLTGMLPANYVELMKI
ncbi:LIM and SH3 domain protein Lasp [Anopheles gambiae]|uniref:LIM and SH3 domain protein Lasp n=1 Tax=Anopheles gambiae TaxID=7165 RepID=UPI002AC8A5BE|nr:LIM and SH3 domain protein Lasp [Anopheles gambiae]